MMTIRFRHVHSAFEHSNRIVDEHTTIWFWRVWSTCILYRMYYLLNIKMIRQNWYLLIQSSIKFSGCRYERITRGKNSTGETAVEEVLVVFYWRDLTQLVPLSVFHFNETLHHVRVWRARVFTRQTFLFVLSRHWGGCCMRSLRRRVWWILKTSTGSCCREKR